MKAKKPVNGWLYWTTDAGTYGGSGRGNAGAVMAEPRGNRSQPASAVISLPPMATLYLDYVGS